MFYSDYQVWKTEIFPFYVVATGSNDKAKKKSGHTFERFSKHICIVDNIQWSGYVSLIIPLQAKR